MGGSHDIPLARFGMNHVHALASRFYNCFMDPSTWQPSSDFRLAGPIPAELGTLAALKWLFLGGNYLSGESQWVNLMISPGQVRHESRVCVGE